MIDEGLKGRRTDEGLDPFLYRRREFITLLARIIHGGVDFLEVSGD